MSAPELEIRWREADDGSTHRPWLVFVHGISTAAWVWDRWAGLAAARGWRSAAVSLRGHGDSAGYERLARWRIRDYVDDVRRVRDDLGEPAVLVGHSMGAIVVRRLLAERSVPAAVLVAPAGARHGAGITALLARRRPWQLLRSLALRPLRFDASDQLSPVHPPPDADEIVARLQDESPLVQLELALSPRPRGADDAPVLVLGAGSDRLVPPVEAVRTARRYDGDCVMFAHMGHLMMLDTGWQAPATRMLDWLETRFGG